MVKQMKVILTVIESISSHSQKIIYYKDFLRIIPTAEIFWEFSKIGTAKLLNSKFHWMDPSNNGQTLDVL